MKLLFKQRAFSWLDSYDIYDENKDTVYTVKGKFSLGHHLIIYDALGVEIGEIEEEILTFQPRFVMRVDGNVIGEIKKEFSFFKPKFHLTCNTWQIQGDILQWDYQVYDGDKTIMTISQELLHWTDTYVMDIVNPDDALYCVMIVLAIDAAKCSANRNRQTGPSF